MLDEKQKATLDLITSVLPLLPKPMLDYLLGYGEAFIDVRQDYEKKIKELEKKLSA